MDENKIKTFFAKLEQALKAEFQVPNYGFLEVLNNYEMKKEYNLLVKLTLSCGIRISLFFDVNFPTKSGPKIYLCEYLESSIVNKITLEVSYESFYLWSGHNCKAIDLVSRLDSYFKANPPTINKELSEASLMLVDLTNSASNKLMNMSYNQAMICLKNNNIGISANSTHVANSFKETSEFRECNYKLLQMANKGTTLISLIIRRS